MARAQLWKNRWWRSRKPGRLVAVLATLVLLAVGCGSTQTETATANLDPSTVATRPDTTRPDTTATVAAAAQDSGTAAESGAEDANTTATETDAAPTQDPTAVATTAAVPSEPSPTAIVRPAAPSGRTAPAVAATATGLAAQVSQAEQGLVAPESTAQERADWGHLHQVAIRKLGYEPDWDIEFFEALPAEYRARTLRHVSARRALIDLSSGYSAADFIPAWEIVEPEPAENLLSYYQAAETATGIEWEILAAINLVETGMGRIRGLSSAGAQGPMQFLPTTWAEAGIGEGDINDPNDAINAAARYLVRRGGPDDMAQAIFGYNNSDNYVTAVQAYAALLRDDPAAYTAIYNWEIYFYTEAGDVWLPAGFRTDESIDLYDYLSDNPWSAPDPGLR